MKDIAHKTKTDIQTIKEHSENTARLAKSFSVEHLKTLNYNIALLHDIGKYQPSFQRRINGEPNIRCPHALCGAKEVSSVFPQSIITSIMQYCIAGHHCGLQDGGTIADSADMSSLCGTLQKDCEDYSKYKDDIAIRDFDDKSLIAFLRKNCENAEQAVEKIDFLIRYCFSCLTDADSLDTAQFCNGKDILNKTSDFKATLDELDKLLSSFKVMTELQKARSKLQEQVYKSTDSNSKIFLINMPTGSGKTLCSLKFALERAVRKRKKRIIYVIPYNSIIDQTAEIFEKNFKSLNILRHQSSFLYEEESGFDEDYIEWALKSIENWDSDFIITTAVQFFESIYKNKRGKLRKLHNMADSIIIFDEAHLMPIKYLEPCMKAIANITDYLNSEAVFLSATMPDFDKLLKTRFNIVSEIKDTIEDKSTFNKFKKCKYQYKSYKNTEELIEDADTVSSLIIVNSKKRAAGIYNSCSGERYHLSTYMTGIGRMNVINKVKERLKQLEIDFGDSGIVPYERRITVVSTSLIEAGVDMDFYSVYRELAGLDSVLQSGGRCNREGYRESGTVTVFEIEENSKPRNDEQAFTLTTFKEYENIDDLEAIKSYYEKLYSRKDFKSFSVYSKGQSPFLINFKTYAENFKLIDDKTVSIVVPVDDFSKEVMESARVKGYANARLIQKYTATVTLWEFEELLKQRVVEDYNTGIFFLTNLDYYRTETGIKFTGEDYYV